jgi:hypothetical protein
MLTKVVISMAGRPSHLHKVNMLHPPLAESDAHIRRMRGTGKQCTCVLTPRSSSTRCGLHEYCKSSTIRHGRAGTLALFSGSLRLAMSVIGSTRP